MNFQYQRVGGWGINYLIVTNVLWVLSHEIGGRLGHFLYKAIDDSWWTWLLTFWNFQVAEFGNVDYEF
ncbi:hypothetical protein K7X08_011380 [Anisodus acutangulus]|uniref:Uncharacterized protein n=1 Tax=Anisodus acutangulus TaxID=402998 RepID=A0A9Q1MKN0_9SOLA|nr:hypothetical protein K7X08_011380 [Anisodus acutangulus]